MRDFRELKVWAKAHKLTLEVYKLSEGFPAAERFGLTSQLRRACSSVPTNIAEGCGRDSMAEYGRFLDIAMGSACEVEYQLVLAKDLGYISVDKYRKFQALLVKVKRMPAAYAGKIRKSRQ